MRMKFAEQNGVGPDDFAARLIKFYNSKKATTTSIKSTMGEEINIIKIDDNHIERSSGS